MHYLYNDKQIRDWDKLTIQEYYNASIDLMEVASKIAVIKIRELISGINLPIVIFCGSGNNGGDGLAIARMLSNNLHVNVFRYACENYSGDNTINYHRLLQLDKNITILSEREIYSLKDFIAIDALFGIGLNRSLGSDFTKIISYINEFSKFTIAIDSPSGLPAWINDLSSLGSNIIEADYTLTFQILKQSFLFEECFKYTGHVSVLDIGLTENYNVKSNGIFITEGLVQPKLKKPSEFAAKFNFGHALLIGGSKGKYGAMVLSSKACINAGCGLVTAHVPKEGELILQIAAPEVMVNSDNSETEISELKEHSKKYNAIGIGMGMGQNKETAGYFERFLKNADKPLLIDADGINIVAKLINTEDFRFPTNVILTPHTYEFEKLVGKCNDSNERIKKASHFSTLHNVILVLKGKYTIIFTPGGEYFINTSGNTLLATAGSGDVLSGIITSLLAKGYTPLDAAILGVYYHGKCAEYLRSNNYLSASALDIVNSIKFVINK